jgi:hypothetical protein
MVSLPLPLVGFPSPFPTKPDFTKDPISKCDFFQVILTIFSDYSNLQTSRISLLKAAFSSCVITSLAAVSSP